MAAQKKSRRETKKARAKKTQTKKVSTGKFSKKKSAKKKTARRKVAGRRTAKQSNRAAKKPPASARRLRSTSIAASEQTRVPWDGTDAEGLSNREDVDSESVGELVDEGNAFEAGVVSGVERADDSEGEVRTREVPEDDVPEEYLDKD